MLRWCQNLDELIEFLALVTIYAPDSFPQEEGDELLDLERAFDDLNYGLDSSVAAIGDASKVSALRSMLREAHELYRSGQVNEGAWKLQEIERQLEAL